MVENILERVPSLPWVILFSPLLATVIISFFFLKSPKPAVWTALVGILIALAGSVLLFISYRHTPHLSIEIVFPWIKAGALRVDFGFLIDRLSILMLLIVSGVGSCIFFYSAGYMKGDSSYPRYFASLSLFAFSMLGIVLANNFLMLFVFWELVAVSSYLLIGFWFEKSSAADAGNKAFIVNRIADFGFVLGIFTVWMLSGLGGAERTFDFTKLAVILPEYLKNGLIAPALMGVAALLVFCGVIGKSAQFPLYIWLPDAMEGPTPVSALIHAATMVAAGVYLFVRVYFLVAGLEAVLLSIAVIGALTALLAAGLAVVQNDIKKILAYSTICQLGYMVLALGLGGPTEAMYHLTTHAFFKALLFLGAGAMIHYLHTQDIWEMGGLRKKMPVTAYTFLIGTLALCGIPPLSGFFSKDEILLLAFEKNRILFVMALFTAGLTAFYMTRAVSIAVLGAPRPKKHHDNHGPGSHPGHHSEAPMVMKAPLVILAILAVIAGFLGIPDFLKGGHGGHAHLNLFVAGLSVAAALLGIAIGFKLYGGLRSHEDPLKRALGGFHTVLVRKYYFDDIAFWIAGVFDRTLAGILFWFDKNIVIEKGVNGTAALTCAFASFLRRAQTGRVQMYAMVFGFGVAGMIWFVIQKGS